MFYGNVVHAPTILAYDAVSSGEKWPSRRIAVSSSSGPCALTPWRRSRHDPSIRSATNIILSYSRRRGICIRDFYIRFDVAMTLIHTCDRPTLQAVSITPMYKAAAIVRRNFGCSCEVSLLWHYNRKRQTPFSHTDSHTGLTKSQ